MKLNGLLAQRAEAPLVAQMRAAERRVFGASLALAGVIHLILIVLLAAGARRREKPRVEWIELLPEGVLTGGTPASAPPAASPAPRPAESHPVAVPEPVPAPAPAPQPKPVPAPAKPAPVVPAPMPAAPKPPPSKTPVQPQVRQPSPKPPAPKKEAVKVNLEETVRPSKAAAATPHTRGADKPAPAAGPSLDAAGVRDRLEKRLGRAGVTGAMPGVGPSGTPGGGVPSEVASYYALIRDVYYHAWRQPGVPGRVQLAAVVRVRIAADGRVISATLERGSGDAAMDASVQAVTGVVSEIGQPLPAVLGSQFAEVTITFEF